VGRSTLHEVNSEPRRINKGELAQQTVQTAFAVIDQLKADLQDRGRRASLDQSSMIQGVYGLSASF
jgi:hypothetical protein